MKKLKSTIGTVHFVKEFVHVHDVSDKINSQKCELIYIQWEEVLNTLQLAKVN